MTKQISLVSDGYLPPDGSGIIVDIEHLPDQMAVCVATWRGDLILWNTSTNEVRMVSNCFSFQVTQKKIHHCKRYIINSVFRYILGDSCFLTNGTFHKHSAFTYLIDNFCEMIMKWSCDFRHHCVM